jgi:MFS family permease
MARAALRTPARRVWALIAWGICAMLTGFVRDANEFLLARLLLGAAEGPVSVSTAMLLSQWFLKLERARAFRIVEPLHSGRRVACGPDLWDNPGTH